MGKPYLVFDDSVAMYSFPEDHPFKGSRFKVFINYFLGLEEVRKGEIIVKGFVPPEPSEKELELVHTPEYIELVKNMSKTGIGWLSADTPAFKGMHEASLKMIHATLSAGRYVLENKTTMAIAIGGGLHHAGKNYGEGFCVYNDIAILAKWLLRNGLKKIFIFDYDAHQGNGTMDIFYDSPEVFFFSVHQDPRILYPGQGFTWQIGRGEGKGYTCNVPLPLKAGKKSYEAVINELLFPLMQEFKPDMLIANGGSDPHFLDPLTDLGLDMEGFHFLGRKIREASERTCGRTVDAIASGYDEKIIPRAWTSLIYGLCGLKIRTEEKENFFESKKTVEKTRQVVNEVKRALAEYWSF